MPELPDLLWLAAVVILGAWLLVAGYLIRKEQRAYIGAACAWCVWRAGDDCTNPQSPICGGSCEPVCTGRLPCKVRQERRP